MGLLTICGRKAELLTGHDCPVVFCSVGADFGGRIGAMGFLSVWQSFGSNWQGVAKGVARGQSLPALAIPSPSSSANRGSFLLDEGIDGRKARLPPAYAVEMFVVWMQRRGDVGITSSARVLSFYSKHCMEFDLAEVPANLFLKELARVAPRSSERVHRRDGVRGRARAYAIPAAHFDSKVNSAPSA